MINNFQKIVGRKIKVCVVGCGRISNKHFESIEIHKDNIKLVAVCDVDSIRLDKAVKRTKATGFKSYTAMLDECDADMVILTTPSGMHSKQTILAAESGFHVMTEKPMATRWNDGLAMVDICDRLGVRLFVVKQNRRNATLQLLKKAFDDKRFGKIYLVNINVFWTRPQEYYDQDEWRGTWEFDGGALMNQASHYVDLLDWLIGPVASIQAMTTTLARDIEVEDTAVMNVKWRSGAVGSMNVTMLTYPKNLEGSITIIGEKGTAKIGGVAVNEVLHWEFEDEIESDKKIKEASYQTTSVYGFGHPLYYENVIKAIRGEVEPETDGREGLHSLELLIAAYLSARDGSQVSLPLKY